jgi:hypothetical protein
MAPPSGIAAQWCAFDEATYGVSLLTTPKFFACDSDSLKLRKVPKDGTGIYAGAQFETANRRYALEYNAGGALPMDLPERGLQQWLFRMMGSFGQAASALTQDGVTGAYSATHAPGFLDGHSFTLQAGRPDIGGTVKPATYVGSKVSEWEISCAMNSIAKLNLTIEARNELFLSWKDPLNGSVPTLQAFTAPAGGAFRWVGASVHVGGTPSTTSGVTSLSGSTLAGHVTGPISVKYQRQLKLDRYAPDVAPFRNEPITNGRSNVSGQLVVEWLNTDSWTAAYQNDSATAIQYTFIAEAIGSGSDFATLDILVPNVRLNGDSPSVGGVQVLEQTVPWVARDDGVNNVIQLTYWTTDSA